MSLPSASSAGARLIGLQFAMLAVIWGSSFLFIRVALGGVNPAQIALFRVLLGALILCAIMLITKRHWPRGLRTWATIGTSSVFAMVIPFLLYAWAGQYVPSSVSAIYNACVPFLTILAALVLLPGERLTRGRIAALFVGLAGVVLLAAPWTLLAAASAGSSEIPGSLLALAHLACLGANVSYGIAYALIRRMMHTMPHDSVTFAASQLVVAAAITLLIMPFIGGLEPMTLTPAILGALLALGVLGSGFAYIWNTNVLRAWGAARASTVTYLTPVVGVVLGVLVLSEPLHWNEPVGGIIILLGVIISQGGFSRFNWRSS